MEVEQIIGQLVMTRIIKAEGHLDIESLMSLTGCSREMATTLICMWLQEGEVA